nr:PEP-CTERM sorting domain-containing protein [Marinobacter changyiensis]
MKKRSFLIPLSVLLVAATAPTQAALITATNSNGGVADGSAIERSVYIADSGEITDVNITVSWSKCGAGVTNNLLCAGNGAFPFPDEPSMNLTGPTGANTVLFPASFFTLNITTADDNGGGPGPVPSPAPEPGTLVLLGLGLAGIGLARRRRPF